MQLSPNDKAPIIRHPLTLHWIDPGDRKGNGLETTWFYDEYDPYAIGVDFGMSAERPIVWKFSRELAADGLTERAGIADVQFRPPNRHRPDVRMRLSSPEGEAALWVPTRGLARFITEVYKRVPRGKESERTQSSIDYVLRRCNRIEAWRRTHGHIWPNTWSIIDIE